jgi:hypothetical protein
MPSLDLIYDRECPNAGVARDNLTKALQEVGLAGSWTEHIIGNASARAYVQAYGSPTILVDGQDVAGLSPSGEASCRLYTNGGRHAGAPSVELIAAAIRNSIARSSLQMKGSK